MNVIECNKLAKSFGKVADLQVPAGMEVKADEFEQVHLIFAEEQ